MTPEERAEERARLEQKMAADDRVGAGEGLNYLDALEAAEADRDRWKAMAAEAAEALRGLNYIAYEGGWGGNVKATEIVARYDELAGNRG